jgi:hypothetical protein
MSCDEPKLNEITPQDVAEIISMTAKEHGGTIPKDSLAARLQSLADRNAIASSRPKRYSAFDEFARLDGIDAYKMTRQTRH